MIWDGKFKALSAPPSPGLPDPVEIKTPWVSFTRNVTKLDERRVVVEDISEMRAYSLPKSSYDEYAEFLFKRQLASRQHVVIELMPSER